MLSAMERNSTESEESIDHDRDEAIIGADDTGMLAEQRIIVVTEIAEELAPEELPQGGT